MPPAAAQGSNDRTAWLLDDINAGIASTIEKVVDKTASRAADVMRDNTGIDLEGTTFAMKSLGRTGTSTMISSSGSATTIGRDPRTPSSMV